MRKDLSEILRKAKTVAVIGCSANKYRTSYHIANYLKENGMRVIPINPNYDEILGVRCYDKMTDVSADIHVDIIDIFRDSQYTAEMVEDILDWSKETGQKPVIWTQLSVSSDEAKSMAEENGFSYVENKCMMVEHDQLT